jgi:hypothetical protein
VAESFQGKGCVTLFLFAFFAAGVLFTALVLRELPQQGLTYTWPTAQCAVEFSRGVLDAGVRDSEPPYRFDITYRYQWDGREYKGSAISGSGSHFRKWSAVRELEKRYPAGSTATCYVNRDEPSQALLERPKLWLALILPLPLIFVLIGGGGIYFVWFPPKDMADSTLISDRARRKGRQWGLTVLFAIFTLAGAGVFIPGFVQPLRMLVSARGWPQSDCTVLFSRVGEHEGEDSTTYSVDVLYSWQSGGREFRSSRYRLFDFSSSGYSAKQDIVARLKPGSSVPCYVNPADPEEAILNRDFSPLFFLGLIPLGFFLAGAAGLWNRLGGSTGQGESAGPTLPGPSGQLILKPSASPLLKLAGCGCFTLMWNGILSLFVTEVITGWMRGRSPYFETLFLTPFVAVGLAGAGAVIYFFLGVFSPQPVLALTSGRLSPGCSVTLDWRIPHNAGAVESFFVTLEGREEATYARGTTTTTDKEVFATANVVEASPVKGFAHGLATVKIPAGTMHSFNAPHNKVVWLLKAKGGIRYWPDIDLEFPIEVKPETLT